jgi:hypothetical protein
MENLAHIIILYTLQLAGRHDSTLYKMRQTVDMSEFQLLKNQYMGKTGQIRFLEKIEIAMQKLCTVTICGVLFRKK